MAEYLDPAVERFMGLLEDRGIGGIGSLDELADRIAEKHPDAPRLDPSMVLPMLETARLLRDRARELGITADELADLIEAGQHPPLEVVPDEPQP